MVEVTVSRLGRDSTTNAFVVILREKGGDRLLPIWIGQPEAESIAMEMNQIKRERPLTHDLCRSIIIAMGASLRRVQITRVQKSTYFAELFLHHDGGTRIVDARPSDSIAIALRLAAPIFAEDALLTSIDIIGEGEDEEAGAGSADAAIAESERRKSAEALDAEQLKAYLENLRPEDFGKFSL